MVTHGSTTEIPTPPSKPSERDLRGIRLAIEEAKLGFEEGGIPIGAVLMSDDGKVLGSGRNRRVQVDSPILHGETDCLNNAGRLPAIVYARSTMYSTLSPCPMCAGACLLYGIPRVVFAENITSLGPETWMRERGVEVINLGLDEPRQMMLDFIKRRPDIWDEDCGEPEEYTQK